MARKKLVSHTGILKAIALNAIPVNTGLHPGWAGDLGLEASEDVS